VFPHYAEAGLRTAGDVDLAVAPDKAGLARQILDDLGATRVDVDVHPGLNDPDHAAYIPGAAWEDLVAHSQRIPLRDIEVRCLGPEDELVLLCIHFMRHTGIRPMWLCDVAAALESRPPNFDWGRGLSRPPYRSWIAGVLFLANELLGADLSGVPLDTRDAPPRRLKDMVLSRWGGLGRPENEVRESILQLWRNPSRWPGAVRERVPDPVAATIEFHGSLNDPLVLRYQLRYLLRTLTRFARRTL
jgi:hypothetical protein